MIDLLCVRLSDATCWCHPQAYLELDWMPTRVFASLDADGVTAAVAVMN